MVDAQSGHEKTLTGLLTALAGANLIYGAGMLESGMTIDYGQLVMDAEFARLIKYTVAGVPVNDVTLSLDVINDVGPFKDFLSHEDTLRHMRTQASPRSSTAACARSGAPTARRPSTSVPPPAPARSSRPTCPPRCPRAPPRR